MSATVLYLVRHGATGANLAQPPLIQGRRLDPPLAPAGVRQAEAARDLLAGVPLAACYTSPLLRAAQTAAVVAAPHGLTPVTIAELAECDVGRWEGLSWPAVAALDPQGHRAHHADPAASGYPGGESFADVLRRCAPAFESLLARHAGARAVAVSHHAVLRTYLAGLLGLPPALARRVVLANGAVWAVTRQGGRTLARQLGDASPHPQA